MTVKEAAESCESQRAVLRRLDFSHPNYEACIQTIWIQLLPSMAYTLIPEQGRLSLKKFTESSRKSTIALIGKKSINAVLGSAAYFTF